jgi:hypothetical protein
LGLSDLKAVAQAQTSWLWQGYLAPGNVTLLTSQWKSGKTTLVAVLLSRLQSGGLLAGLPLRPGKAVIVSEESPQHWFQRSLKLTFGDHLCWYCRPFRGKPRTDEWLSLLEHLRLLHAQRGFDLLVIDPLASFLPGRNESNAGDMLAALLPLQQLTTQGVSVLVLHHPRKGEPLWRFTATGRPTNGRPTRPRCGAGSSGLWSGDKCCATAAAAATSRFATGYRARRRSGGRIRFTSRRTRNSSGRDKRPRKYAGGCWRGCRAWTAERRAGKGKPRTSPCWALAK